MVQVLDPVGNSPRESQIVLPRGPAMVKFQTTAGTNRDNPYYPQLALGSNHAAHRLDS